jgi:hypothetical protein
LVKQALQPGGGVFIFIPGSTATNITIVGQVMAPNTNLTTYAKSFQFTSFQWPVSGFLTTNFNYAPNQPVSSVDDIVEIWNTTSQSFATHKFGGASWTAGSPNLAVGQPFFLVPNQTTVWTNKFSY